jgi:phenylalanyl-tRNA synthetase beta chain
LRPSLIPNLLKNVAENQRFFKEVKIFELGKIFMTGQNREKRMLTCLMTGDSFFEAKGVLDLFVTKLGISKMWYDNYKATPEASSISIWLPKKCAEIKIDNEEIGFLGEISPRILERLKITGTVVIFDLDFEKLLKLASEEHEFRPISAYPAAIRDIAILVPRGVLVEEVLNKIETVGGKLIRDVDLFDIYEGEELPDSKKNLAFHIIYQAEDRTLSSGDIDKIHKKIIKALEEDPEWEVRK